MRRAPERKPPLKLFLAAAQPLATLHQPVYQPSRALKFPTMIDHTGLNVSDFAKRVGEPGAGQGIRRLIILGATGLVGQHVLAQALADPSAAQVVAPTRRMLAPAPKLLNPIVDFKALPKADWWAADAVVCCLGTTL